MRRLLLVAAILAAGCRGAADPCGVFRLQSCLALRVSGALGGVDQIEVSPLSGFSIAEARTPRTAGAPFTLPVVVPIGLENFSGEFSLLARALRGGSELAFGTASGKLAAREHKIVEVSLVPTQPIDGGGVDAPCSSSLDDDPRHCGSCDNDCTALPFVDETAVRCVAGACDFSGACRPGHAHCSTDPKSGCETEISTAANCGGCNAACLPAAPLCARDDTAQGGYACIVGCGGATPDRCGESCVDLASDPMHCGSCDRRCDLPVGGTAVCSARACDFTCGAGSKKIGAECLEWEPEASGVTTRLNGVWGSSASDVYVVGEAGVVLRSVGDGAWTPFTSPGTSYSLLAVGGSGPDDVVVTGGIYVFRKQGDAWVTSILGVVQFSIAAGGAFLGGFASIYRREGADSWVSKNMFPQGTVVYAFGMVSLPTITYAGGLNAVNGSGIILQSNDRGETWITGVNGAFPGLNALWGVEDDLYACGYVGTIVHREGTLWKPQASGTSAKLFGGTNTAAGVTVVGELGTILFSARDGRWIPQRSGTTVELRGVWGIGNDLWAVGADGVILRKVK